MKILNFSIIKSSDDFMCTTYASPHLEADLSLKKIIQLTPNHL